MNQNNNDSDWLPEGYFKYVLILVMIGIGSWGYHFLYVKKPAKHKSKSKRTISFPTENDGAKIEEGTDVAAKVAAESYVKKMLRNPDVAEFPFKAIITKRKTGNSIEYIVESYVDVKNSSGISYRQHFICRLLYSGNFEFLLINMDFIDNIK